MGEKNVADMSLDEKIYMRNYVDGIVELIKEVGGEETTDSEDGSRNKAADKFVKLYALEKFEVFNPKSGHCLSGAEWAVFMYMLTHHLRYIQTGAKYQYGNWIKMDAISKQKIRDLFGMSQKSYERLITKLVNGKVFLRIQNDFFLVNPYCFAKGKNVEFARKKSVLPSSSGTLVCLTEEQKEMIKGCKRLAASIQEEIEREREVQKAILAEKADVIREGAKKISKFLFVDELLEKKE